jgi:hypothetical protein
VSDHRLPGAPQGARPGDPMPGLPNGMSREMAEAAAVELNWWMGTREHVQPGYLSFNAKVVKLRVMTEDGADLQPAVQLIASTQLGPIVLHLPPGLADELAALLSTKAQEARTGIELVRGGSLRPHN